MASAAVLNAPSVDALRFPRTFQRPLHSSCATLPRWHNQMSGTSLCRPGLAPSPSPDSAASSQLTKLNIDSSPLLQHRTIADPAASQLRRHASSSGLIGLHSMGYIKSQSQHMSLSCGECALSLGFAARSRCSSSGSSGSESPPPSAQPVAFQSQPLSLKSITSNSCAESPGICGGLDKAVASGKAHGKSGLIIWFHFLGGKGADWEQCLKSKIAQQLPWVEWFFPDAPKRAVTNYDGAVVPAWFDQLQAQVSESMGTPGLEESVATAHALIRQAEASGIPANRIILGGMSQGGVLALTAGLKYHKALAGVIALSSWVPQSLRASIRQPTTPLLLANGDSDEVVPLDVFLHGSQVLELVGCKQITKKQYPGLTHTFAHHESEDIKQFVSAFLPNLVQRTSSAPLGSPLGSPMSSPRPLGSPLSSPRFIL